MEEPHLVFIFSERSGKLGANDGVSCPIYLFLLFSSKANTNVWGRQTGARQRSERDEETVF